MNRLPRDTEGTGQGGRTAEEIDCDSFSHADEVKHTEPPTVKPALPQGDYNSPLIELNDGDDPVKLADLIKTRRLERGLNQVELARRVGISKAALSDIESGKTRSLRGSTLAGISRELGLSPDELSGKKHLPRAKIGYARPASTVPFGPATLKRIPVMGAAVLDSQGYWLDMQPLRGVLDFPSDDEKAYAVRILSNTLHPRVRAGEYVVLEPGHECIPGDEVLLRLHDGRSMIRELAHVTDGIVAVNGLTDGPRETFRDDEIDGMDFVAAIVKSTRFSEV
jgi:transcriptional regulator with XRE-family HTH domain